MTNFEYMKQQIIKTVSGMDEMELLRLAEDAEMSACGMEGVFCCTVCEEEYGECNVIPCTSENNRRYLEWCKKEYSKEIKDTQFTDSRHGKLQDMVYAEIDDKTKVILRKLDNKTICSGHWFNDNVLEYMHEKVSNFARKSANTVIVWLDK